MNEQELNKKLAEWQGGFHVHFNEHLGRWRWQAPDGDWDIDFTQSLDACFKWLYPQLRKELGFLDLEAFMKRWVNSFTWRDDKPALSLCLAIEKLIDKEVNNV